MSDTNETAGGFGTSASKNVTICPFSSSMRDRLRGPEEDSSGKNCDSAEAALVEGLNLVATMSIRC